MFMEKQTILEKLYDQAIESCQKEDFSKVDSLINQGCKIKSNEPDVKARQVHLASLYLGIVDSLIQTPNIHNLEIAKTYLRKFISQYNKNGTHLVENFRLSLKAFADSLNYDLWFFEDIGLRQRSSQMISPIWISSIFQSNNHLNDSIFNYRLLLLRFTSESHNEPQYEVANNLANNLGKTGRFTEALTLFRQLITVSPNRFSAYASMADFLLNFQLATKLNDSDSFLLNVLGFYSKAYLLCEDSNIKKSLRNKAKETIKNLRVHYKTENLIELTQMNWEDETNDYQFHSNFRKYILSEDLSLNEHSLFCKCRNSGIDNLSLGAWFGSNHLMEDDSLRTLDSLLNRIISEYTFARKLFYEYKFNESSDSEDIKFSKLSEDLDFCGYNIERLRTSYRLVYGILDKIKHGVGVHLKRDFSKSYFEDFFHKHKNDFNNSTNIHLAAIYSISIELERGSGNLKYFKTLRNQLEHNHFSISSNEFKLDFEYETLNLLRLTRSAIFSFAFYVRTETQI